VEAHRLDGILYSNCALNNAGGAEVIAWA
jgi:hypothetical protein